MDGSKASAQILHIAQETRLAPQGVSQVAQGVEDVARAGEKDANHYHWDFNERLMRQGERTGQRAEEAEEENAARDDGREKRVEEDEKRGRFAQNKRLDAKRPDSPSHKR